MNCGLSNTIEKPVKHLSEHRSFYLSMGGEVGGGGKFPYKKNSVRQQILKRAPNRYQEPVLWAWLDFFSTAKMYQF